MIYLNSPKLSHKYIYFVSFLLITTSLLIVKSINTEITVDEAYSFLNYSFTGDYLNIGIANNHILNSFLVGITTNFGISEFLIRIPNLLCGIVYVLFVLKLANDSKQYIMYSLILLLNPYIIDFYSLSRGYGIASLMIFISCYFYLSSNENNITIPLFFLTIATLSYHVTVVFLISFWLITINELFKQFDKIKFYLFNFIVLSVSLLNIFILFNITSESKPLYGVNSLTFSQLLVGSFGLNNLYINQNIIFNSLLSVFFLVPIVLYKKFNPRHKKIIFVSYLSLILIYFIPFIFDRPYPFLRTVLPFLPPILLMISESLNISEKYDLYNYFSPLVKVFILFLFFNFLNIIKINQSIEWKNEFTKSEIISRDLECNYIIPFEDLGSVGQYYRLLEDENINNQIDLDCNI